MLNLSKLRKAAAWYHYCEQGNKLSAVVCTSLQSIVLGTNRCKEKRYKGKGRKRRWAEHCTTEAYLLVSSSLYNDDRCMSGLLIWYDLVGVETLRSPWQMYFNCLGASACLTKLIPESMCSKREQNTASIIIITAISQHLVRLEEQEHWRV